MKNYLRISFLLVLLASSISAQIKRDPDSPVSPAEQRVMDYFKAFNSGDEKVMAAYFTENVTTESLKQRPVDQRLQFYREMRADLKTVEVRRILVENDNEFNVLAESQTGDWVEFSFILEPQPPHKLAGIRIEMTGAPNNAGPDPSSGKGRSPLTEAEFVAETGKFLDELVKNDDFSGVVLIGRNDKAIFAKAYGLANKENGVPNRLDTKFNLGSINKSFTQIAIGQLAARRKISLDDKLGKYLPDYPNKEAAEKVSIRHLLTMTSGVGDFFGEKFDAAPKEKLRNINDFIPLFSDKPLAFEPGKGNQYSNGGYILLGAIIEKVTGQSYYDYVRENIFKPFGMTNTDSYESDKNIPNRAEGYTTEGVAPDAQNRRRSNLDTRPARGSSAGGGYSTAEDLLKFSLALQTGKIQIPKESPARNDSQGKFMGMGIAGGAPGINAVLEIMPETGYTIIVLSNYDPPSAEKVNRQLRNYLGRVSK